MFHELRQLADRMAPRLLTSSWREGIGGPGRKFFAVTEQGRAHLDARATA